MCCWPVPACRRASWPQVKLLLLGGMSKHRHGAASAGQPPLLQLLAWMRPQQRSLFVHADNVGAEPLQRLQQRRWSHRGLRPVLCKALHHGQHLVALLPYRVSRGLAAGAPCSAGQ